MTDVKVMQTLTVDGDISASGNVSDGAGNTLANKLDKLTTKPTAGTFKEITINAEGQVTGGANPTTLAGYGITDAVTLNTAQTITGAKTFSNPLVTSDLSLGDNDTVPLGAPHIRLYSTRKIGEVNNQNLSTIDTYDGNSVLAFQERVRVYSTYIRYDQSLRFDSNNLSGTTLVTQNDGVAYLVAPSRTYNSANVNDVVTIGSLASNPSVVHTTGNETIGGLKTMTSRTDWRGDKNYNTENTEVYQSPFLIFNSLDNTSLVSFNVVQKNGATKLYVRVKNSDNTWKDVALAIGTGY